MRVLKLPIRLLVKGTFSEISPFSGTTSSVVAPCELATAIPSAKNNIDRAR